MANTLRFKRGLVSGIPNGALGEPLFTTDTFDLYIGNGTGNTRFQKYIASGTTSQLLRGDGSLLTMPIVLTSPATGQVLKFNGTNWVNDSDAGITGSGANGQVAFFTGATTQSGSNNLFWDATNNRLGIGTNNPLYRFHTISSDATIGAFRNSGAALGQLLVGNTAGDLQVRILASGDGYILADTGKYLAFGSNGLERVRIFSGGNVAIGSTSDNGLRFQVTGDGFFRGSGNTSASTALTIQNSDAVNLFRINNAGFYTLSGPNGLFFSQFTTNDGTSDINGTNTQFYNYTTTQAATLGAFLFTGNSFAQTSGAAHSMYIIKGFAPTSGTATFSTLSLSPVINQTGGANGITRGIHITPTLTSAADFRAIESNIASGTGRWNLYMNGSAANFLNGELLVGTTTSAGTKLNVSGSTQITSNLFLGVSASSNSILYLFNSTNTGRGEIYYDGTNNAFRIESTYGGTGTYRPMTFWTSATERMRLDASGNLGLGVTPSAWNTLIPLQIARGSFTANNSELDINHNAFYDGAWKYIANGFATNHYTTSGTYVWRTAPSGTAGAAITFTQAMTLFATGNLAVGTTTDAGFRLDVNGTMRVSGASTFTATGAAISITNSGDIGVWSQITNAGGTLYVGRDNAAGASFGVANAHVIYGTAARPMVFFTNGVERFRLSDTGAATFSSTVTGASFIPTSSTIPTNGMYLAAANTLAFATNSTEDMRLDASGNLGLGVVPSAWSLTDLSAMQIRNGGFYGYSVNEVGVTSNSFFNAGWKYINSSFATQYSTFNGAHRWYNAPSGTAGAAITFTQAMTLFASGNLAIGTTTDAGFRLRVNGTSYFDDNLRFPNQRGVVFQQTGGTLLGSISMDTGNAVTISNNGFFGVSVGTNFTMVGGNLGIGQGGAVFGNGTRVISVGNGTAPTTSVATSFLMYSANITTGNAAPHFRTENGAVIKLYQQDNSIAAANFVAGIGTNVTTLDAFDGYTIGQVVKALRNAGILS